MKKKLIAAAIVVAFAGAGAVWYGKTMQETEKQSAKPAQPPAVTVGTAAARQMDVPVRLTANGNVSSLNSVDIRPQVTNTIVKVHFREGQFVKAGEVLFSLDDRADRVNLQKAEAQLEKDKATLADQERQLARSKELFSKGFISQSAVDTVATQVEAQRATLRADEAAVAAARVALSYDVIRATSNGRAGVISVFPGSLVQPSPTAAPLVTISQLDPIAVTFTLPETELQALLGNGQAGGSVKVAANVAGRPAPLEGKLSFVDNAIDPQTGTVKVKAIFPNAEQALWPGQYVPISATVREIKDGVVIPQAAIITGIDSRVVYVVDADKTAKPRRVEVIYSFGTDAVVNGVKAGEIVVVDGKQNLRPGSKVREAEAGGQGGKGRSKAENKEEGRGQTVAQKIAP
ncbi:efflux RND transporter periplasmic adaptor subunit [Noviherbaspirillum humi]|nr:efflux RND transporter periplasmic adaptor subunit [Noviherbaspirillum humi]